MVGFITEGDLQQAETAFPGIVRFFESLPCRPRTFLELLAQFDGWSPGARTSVEAGVNAVALSGNGLS